MGVIQRMENGKELWSHFCDRSAKGRRDPAAYTVEELDQFLQEVDPNSNTHNVQSEYDELQMFVNKIRQGQKQSEDFKQAWIEHCMAYGGDVRDPARHNAEFIRQFLMVAPEVEAQDQDPRRAALIRQIKDGQRISEEFKAAWWTFCAESGRGLNDPAKHPTNYLQTFIESNWPPPGLETSGKSMGGKAERYRYSPYCAL